MENQLKVQIWSDVMCPFCYIGKRKIEEALTQFENKDSVIIEWRSFQLDPNFVATPNETIVDHLAEKYRRDTDWAQGMVDNVTENAKQSGLEFHFEKAILANSLNAHRLMHLAKKHKQSNQVKELLFKAHFTEGKNVNDWNVLKEIGLEVGIEISEIEQLINSNEYTKEVLQDQQEAQSLGITGVPFFVFDNKYAVSGAQPTEAFLKTLEKAWEEGKFETSIKIENTVATNSCTIEGCE